MKNNELAGLIRGIVNTEELEDALFYGLIGIRFDSKQYEIGDTLPESKALFSEEDAREFPQYGTDEYRELPTMGGTSVYHIPTYLEKLDANPNGQAYDIEFAHGTIVVAKESVWVEVVDDGETVLENPVVIAKLN